MYPLNNDMWLMIKAQKNRLEFPEELNPSCCLLPLLFPSVRG